MTAEKGWIEKRRQGRIVATLKADYRVVEGKEAGNLLDDLLKFAAEIGPTESFTEMRQALHRAGLNLRAVHQGDVESIEKSRDVEKLRGELKYGLQQLGEKASLSFTA